MRLNNPKTHIPQAFIDELLTRVDIVEIIDARVPLKSAGKNNHKACCPFHQEKSPSFNVNASKQLFYCFGCQKGGNVITFLMDYEHLGFVETIQQLAAQVGLSLPQGQTAPHSAPVKDSEDLYVILAKVQQFYQQQLQQSSKAQAYFEKRGLSTALVQRFGLGYAPPGWDNLAKQFPLSTERQKLFALAGLIIEKDNGGYYDRFRDRVMFPIYDRQGRIIGFGGRVLDDSTPKYLNSPETPVFHKSSELYGLYQARQQVRQFTSVLIVEGYMDVLALQQHEFFEAVATLGTATTEQHLNRLFQHADKLIFCFDGDNAGKKAAWRALTTLLPLLKEDRQARFLFLPDGEDPDSLLKTQGHDAFAERLAQAQPLPDYFFEYFQNQYDLSELDSRAQFAQAANKHLLTLPDSLFRTMMQQKLAKLAQCPLSQLTGKPSTEPKRPLSKPAMRQSNHRVTPMRLAIALLLQHPSLYSQYPNWQWLATSSLDGASVLLALFECLKNNPDLRTGALLEHWRDHPHGKILQQLVHLSLLLPEDGVANEWLGAMKKLYQMNQEHAISTLLAQARTEGLSVEQKQQLQQLIAETKQAEKI